MARTCQNQKLGSKKHTPAVPATRTVAHRPGISVQNFIGLRGSHRSAASFVSASLLCSARRPALPTHWEFAPFPKLGMLNTLIKTGTQNRIVTKLMNMINTFTHNEQIHDIYNFMVM